jgi:hypothetical protein
MPRAELPPDITSRFIKGQSVDLLKLESLNIKNNQLVRVYDGESFLGIGKVIEKKLLKPEKILV